MCKYCEHTDPQPEYSDDLDISGEQSCSTIYIERTDDGVYTLNADQGAIYAVIKFCPVCGRKLSAGTTDGV